MNAPFEDDDLQVSHGAMNHLAAMSGDLGYRKMWNRGVICPSCAFQYLVHCRKTAAHDYRDIRKLADFIEQIGFCLFYRLEFHKRMPAMVAVRKVTIEPAINALSPKRARSCFRPGASAPMPPI